MQAPVEVDIFCDHRVGSYSSFGRGLSGRAVVAARVVGVDETSFQRRHEYVTVVNDLTTSEPGAFPISRSSV